MDRRSLPRYGRLFLLLLPLASLVAFSGCVSALATALWLVRGGDTPAEFDGLRDKQVVVACRPLTSSLYAHPGVAKDISRQVTRLLGANVRKIDMVDQRKVDEWIDSNTWDDYSEIGKALEADMVVGIDLETFGIYAGQTLFQGKADYAIQVYDCQKNDVVFERFPPQSVYPPNHVVSTSSMQEPDFRREYVRVLADEIARHFYAHDHRAYFAADSSVIH